MGLWTSLNWAASEGAGTGVNRRLIRSLAMTWQRNAGTRSQDTSGMVRQFLAHAKISIDRFGPGWTLQRIGSQPLGVWLLIVLWVAPLLVVFWAALSRFASFANVWASRRPL